MYLTSAIFRNFRKISTIPSLIDCIILTNGTQLTDAVIEKIIDLKITKIFISLDAATNETYSRIRGANLELVENNIRYLLKRKQERNNISKEIVEIVLLLPIQLFFQLL